MSWKDVFEAAGTVLVVGSVAALTVAADSMERENAPKLKKRDMDWLKAAINGRYYSSYTQHKLNDKFGYRRFKMDDDGAISGHCWYEGEYVHIELSPGRYYSSRPVITIT